MRKSLVGYAAALAVVGGVAMASMASTAGAHTRTARATLRDASGQEIGRVKFVDASGTTEVRVDIQSGSAVAADAFHGFHIHANADSAGCVADPAQLSNTWFTSAGGHWKSGTQTHGQHVGDMPSVFVNADGSVETRFTISRIPLSELAGKAVVLHAGADNFGNIPIGAAADQYQENSADAITKTQNTGNAGDRIACGVIAGR
ncbi:MAG TPA: superoxide dismutase family protein [Ilumatobacteraceae bacterium]|nr:superoxide dismutase family protein [Ilumatobacteraceae bacterium]